MKLAAMPLGYHADLLALIVQGAVVTVRARALLNSAGAGRNPVEDVPTINKGNVVRGHVWLAESAAQKNRQRKGMGIR